MISVNSKYIKNLFSHKKGLYWIAGIIIFLGIFLRLKVYFYKQLFWGDESALAINIICGSYADMFKPLVSHQVAPPLFLVIEKLLLQFSSLNSSDITFRDLTMLIFPLFCSIISLPLFAYYLNKVFRNDYLLLTGTFLISFTPMIVNYAQELKQYSCEMLISIILLTAFYSLDIKKAGNKKLWGYSLLFMISPWLSGSSVFVLATGFLVLFIDMLKQKYLNKTKIFILFLPFIISFCVYYFGYFINIKNSHYAYMHNFWSNILPSFFSTSNFSNLLLYNLKHLMPFYAGIYSFAFLMLSIIILFNSKNYKSIILTLGPIILCITASFMQYYPFYERLILFLCPMFIVLFSQFALLLNNQKITRVVFYTVLTLCIAVQFIPDTRRFIMHKKEERGLLLYPQKIDDSAVKWLYTNPHEYYKFTKRYYENR